MANPKDIERGSIRREAQGAADDLLQDPEVQRAIEVLRRFVDEKAAPVESQFPDGETPIYQFRQTLRGRVIRAVREALAIKPDDKG